MHALHTLLASAIVVVVLALVDAGVPIKGMLAAAFVEEASGSAAHVFGYAITGGGGGGGGGPKEGLVFVESDGVFDEKGFVEASEVGRKRCLEVGELMKGWVREKVGRDMKYRLK